MKTPTSKFLEALRLWLWDVLRNGGFPPYVCPSCDTPQRYNLTRAIKDEPNSSGSVLRVHFGQGKDEVWIYKKDKLGRTRYPKAILRRLGR